MLECLFALINLVSGSSFDFIQKPKPKPLPGPQPPPPVSTEE